MSEPLIVAEKIQKKIELLETMRIEIKDRAINKANAISEYDKVLAVTIIKLKNKVEMELDGQKIIDPPASYLEKIARGICYKEKLEMEKGDALFKSLNSNMNSVMAELTGYECINKYLDKV